MTPRLLAARLPRFPVPRRASLAAAVLLLAAGVPAALADATWIREADRPVAPGVRHLELRPSGSTASVHVAHVRSSARARLTVVQAAGVLRGRETTSDLCRRTRGCLVAVNGDFFTDDGPVGGVVVGDRLLRSPVPGHEQLSVAPLRATAPGLGTDGWSGRVTSDDGAVALSGVNVALPADGAVLYTPDAATPACECVEVVLRGAGAVGRTGAPQAAVVASRAAGRTPPAAGTAVLEDGGGSTTFARAPPEVSRAATLEGKALAVRPTVDACSPPCAPATSGSSGSARRRRCSATRSSWWRSACSSPT